MTLIQDKLPNLEPQAIEHSLRLIHFIREEIAAKGAISFQDYMNHVLYAPGLGYYTAGCHKIGAKGDFITAPEISPLFANCIGQQCQQILAELDQAVILELGAGTGSLAADLLLHLEALQSLPSAYWILEVSADLTQRQKQTFRQRCPHLLDKVQWLTELPKQDFSGVILGNEVLDALPVTQFIIEHDIIKEIGVAWENDKFAYCTLPAQTTLIAKLTEIQQQVGKLANAYQSEVNLLLPHWLNSISQHFQRGVMLWIDYGYSRKEYYAPHRTHGTLQCYYQHRVHDNPLLLPGLQDITAHVDFTAVAEAAHQCGLTISGYNNQMSFLINCGIEHAMHNAISNGADEIKFTQQLKRLLSPQAMGEMFKVIALGKNFSHELLGFNMNSQLFKL